MEAGVSDNLRAQLDEIEMLQAMFPDPKELIVDENSLLEAKSWTDFPTDLPPQPIDITLNITAGNGYHGVEMLSTLPLSYPGSSLPEIYVRSNSLGREQQLKINQDLILYLKSVSIPQVTRSSLDYCQSFSVVRNLVL